MTTRGFNNADCGCRCTVDQGAGHGWGPDCCCVNVGNCDCTGNGYGGCNGGCGPCGGCCGGNSSGQCCCCNNCACAYRNLPTPDCDSCGCSPCGGLGGAPANYSGPWYLNSNGYKTRAGACCPIVLRTDPTTDLPVQPWGSFNTPDTSGADQTIIEDCASKCLQACADNDIGSGRCWPCYPPTVLQRLDCTHWQASDLASLTVQGRKLWANPCGYGSFAGYRMWKTNAPEDQALYTSTPVFDREGRCNLEGGQTFVDLVQSVYNQDKDDDCVYGGFFQGNNFVADSDRRFQGERVCGKYETINYVAPTCNNCAGYPINCGVGSTCGCGPCCGTGPYQAGGYGFQPINGLGATQGCAL